MIESIQIKNFQSHKDTFIELSQGVNILKGESHNGKSSIIRAIRWVLFNEPRGEGFKSHFADKKDPVEVTLFFTDGKWVTRRKDAKNSYLSSEGHEFHAVKSDVPDEIKEVLQMDKVNFQGQNDRYFMLEETPGNVGRQLSEIVGLQIINDSRNYVRKVLTDTSSRLSITRDNIETNEEAIEQLKHLEDIAPLIESIQSGIEKVKNLQTRCGTIKQILKEINNRETEIEQIDKWLKVEEGYTELKGLFDLLTDKRLVADQIGMIVRDIQDAEDVIERADDELVQVKKQYAELEKQLDYCQHCGAHRKHWGKK